MSAIVSSWAMQAPVHTPFQRLVFAVLADCTQGFDIWHSISVSSLDAYCVKCVCDEEDFIEACYDLSDLGHLSIAHDPNHRGALNFQYYVACPPQMRERAPLSIPSGDGRRQISRKVRASVMERDGYKCVYCGSQKNLCLDHIVAFSKGGGDEEGNLQTCCRTCNTRKSNKSHDEFMEWLSKREAVL